jgi:predicted exporter
MSWSTALQIGSSVFGMLSSKRSGDRAAALSERLTDAQVRALDLMTEQGKEQYGIEKGIRSNLLKKIYEYQDTLDQVRADLGKSSVISDADIAAEQGRRYRQKVDDANRALRLAGSRSQAQLINQGLDNSTMAIESQRALADKGSELYDKAYTSAYDEALAALQARDQAMKASRMGVIDEARTANEAGINALGATIGAVNPTAYSGTAQQYGTAATAAGERAAKSAGAFGSALDDLIYGRPKRPSGNEGGIVSFL